MTPDPSGLTPAERALVARARYAFTRLCGIEKGDELADELFVDLLFVHLNDRQEIGGKAK